MGSTSISWVLLLLVLRHPLEKGYGNLDTWLKVCWIIGKGNISFWFDKWLDVKIADLVEPPQPLKHLTVNEVVNNVNGCLDQCARVLQPSSINQLPAMAPKLSSDEDLCIWTATTRGKFTLASAWAIVDLKEVICSLVI